LKEKLLDILEEICETDMVKKDGNIDLVESHLIDSFGFIELLAAIEEEFGIELAPTEITREDVATPNKIIEYLTKRGCQ
jgi:D-alanine--poly(phosphoribitol) ligase subunit 2